MPTYVVVCHRELFEGEVELTVFGPYNDMDEAHTERDLIDVTLKDSHWQVKVVQMLGKVGYR